MEVIGSSPFDPMVLKRRLNMEPREKTWKEGYVYFFEATCSADPNLFTDSWEKEVSQEDIDIVNDPIAKARGL